MGASDHVSVLGLKRKATNMAKPAKPIEALDLIGLAMAAREMDARGTKGSSQV